jgi:hypothetical protein
LALAGPSPASVLRAYAHRAHLVMGWTSLARGFNIDLLDQSSQRLVPASHWPHSSQTRATQPIRPSIPPSGLPNQGRSSHSARPLALFFRVEFGFSAPHLDGPITQLAHITSPGKQPIFIHHNSLLPHARGHALPTARASISRPRPRGRRQGPK